MDSDAYTGDAAKLYRSLGFEVPGTPPKGFRHRPVQRHGAVVLPEPESENQPLCYVS